MNFFNRDDNSDGIGDKLKNKAKKKITAIAVGGISSLLPILFFGALFVALVSPVLMFVDKTAGIFDSNGDNNNKNSFENTILDLEEKYSKDPYNVQIDKELILSVLLYGRGYDFDGDYTLDCNTDATNSEKEDDTYLDDCETFTDDKKLNKQLSKNAKKLAQGMIKKRTLYSCQHYYQEAYEDCNTTVFDSRTKSFSYLLRIETDGPTYNKDEQTSCTTKYRTTYDPVVVCGYGDNASVCDNLCEADYEVTSEVVYDLKTKEEFTTWLKLSSSEKDEFGDKGYDIKQKMKDADITLPEDDDELDEFLDDAIGEIYDTYYVARSNSESGNGTFTDVVDPYGGDFSQWYQCNPAWGSISLGSSSNTVCSAGCLVSSLTVQLVRSGTYIDYDFLGSSDLNPGTFVSRISNYSAFTGGGAYIWGNSGAAQVAPNFHYKGQTKLSGSWDNKLSIISSALQNNEFLILIVRNGNHWVAVTGIQDRKVTIVDTGGWGKTCAGEDSSCFDASGVIGFASYSKSD